MLVFAIDGAYGNCDAGKILKYTEWIHKNPSLSMYDPVSA